MSEWQFKRQSKILHVAMGIFAAADAYLWYSTGSAVSAFFAGTLAISVFYGMLLDQYITLLEEYEDECQTLHDVIEDIFVEDRPSTQTEAAE